MSEKKIVIDGLELHYEGLFDLDELLSAIDKYSKERGYSKSEKRRHETIKPESKQFSMELRPAKVKTEYYSLMLKIRINITNLKEVEVKKDKVKTKLNKGDITMLFDAWAVTDYRNRWENKPLYYFLMTVVDKFIYKFHSDKFHGELIEDTQYIYQNIKAHLNLHRF
ncbi:hypothetical protein GF361_02960 [Candidatus Woesearchaeota archaeon]|nr:hypothetical protein [Candidatus Woesearchaeota archaeon]